MGQDKKNIHNDFWKTSDQRFLWYLLFPVFLIEDLCVEAHISFAQIQEFEMKLLTDSFASGWFGKPSEAHTERNKSQICGLRQAIASTFGCRRRPLGNREFPCGERCTCGYYRSMGRNSAASSIAEYPLVESIHRMLSEPSKPTWWNTWRGEKNLIKFDNWHNSSRGARTNAKHNSGVSLQLLNAAGEGNLEEGNFRRLLKSSWQFLQSKDCLPMEHQLMALITIREPRFILPHQR